MAEFLGCGLHGVSQVLGHEDELHTIVLACGCKYSVLDLLVPIFEGPDPEGTPPVPAEITPVPIEAAIAAAETLPAEASWDDVVAQHIEATIEDMSKTSQHAPGWGKPPEEKPTE